MKFSIATEIIILIFYPNCSKSTANVKKAEINNFARIGSLSSWIVSLANAKSLFRVNLAHKRFVNRFSNCLQHIV